MSKEIKPGQISLVKNALTTCATMERADVIQHLPFIIMMFIFYFTVDHAKNLIEQDSACQQYIKNTNYEYYISTLIYWVISFVIIIIVKYNKLNTVNHFIIDYKTSDPIITRSKNVFEVLISIITSILNIYFFILFLYVLYKLISEIIELINCNSLVCSKETLCTNSGGEGEYYDSASGTCLNGDFENYSTTTPKEPNVTVSYELTNTSPEEPIDDKDLTEDLLPDSIMRPLRLWTFNTSGTEGTIQSIIGWSGVSIGILLTCIYYIVNKTERSLEIMLITIIGFICFNIFTIIIVAFVSKTLPEDEQKEYDIYRDGITKNSTTLMIILSIFIFIIVAIYRNGGITNTIDEVIEIFEMLSNFFGLCVKYRKNTLMVISILVYFVNLIISLLDLTYLQSKPTDDDSWWKQILRPNKMNYLYGIPGFIAFRLPIIVFIYAFWKVKNGPSSPETGNIQGAAAPS